MKKMFTKKYEVWKTVLAYHGICYLIGLIIWLVWMYLWKCAHTDPREGLHVSDETGGCNPSQEEE